MNVRHNGNTELFLNLAEHRNALFKSRTAEAVEGGTIRLVKRCLEDIVDAKALADFLRRASDVKAALEFFENTGSRHKRKRTAATDFKITNLDLMHCISSHLSSS